MNKWVSYFRYWGKTATTEEGKPPCYHLLPYHCLDVAAVGHVLLTRDNGLRHKFAATTGVDEQVCSQLLVMSLALHDIGKFSETFQGLRPDLLFKLQTSESRKPYSQRHDSLGNLFLKTSLELDTLKLPGHASFDEWQDVIMAIVKAYTGHHGRPPQMRGANGLPLNFSSFFSTKDTVAATQFIEDANILLCGGIAQSSFPPPEELAEHIRKASWLMAGFAVLCDWIGSNNTWFSFCAKPMSLADYWAQQALPQAQKAFHEAGINKGVPIAATSFTALFPKIQSPTPLQSFVEQCPVSSTQQLYILEDVTGSGKTEAALLLAGRLMAAGCGNGLFMALPTMATSNAMFSRLADKYSPDESPLYRRLFEHHSRPSIVLAHGARHLSETFMATVAGQGNDADEESASAQCSSWLADNRKKALLADVGVGTLDQALLAVLPARFQSLRLFGLASHILVVDEVHAYDPYMNKLLQNLLAFHAALGGSAILLSATLPTLVRRDFITSFARGCNDLDELELKTKGYPLVSAYSKARGVFETPVEATSQRRCRVEVKLVAEENKTVRLILDAAGRDQCVCWIRNTVHDALAGYEKLKPQLPEANLMLFHARFAMGDRLDIENAVTATFGKKSSALERHGKVLVATQVVEQSLDLDFDLLITDLAPMDLLIQRAGRLHRHPRDEHGNPRMKGPDLRETPCLIIHGPIPEQSADGNWYKTKFEKASFVYPSHGCLWLTARLLMDKGALKMPDDARVLIEAAFSEKTDDIPPTLRQRDEQAEAQWQADKSLAHINMLKLDEGYEATITQWREDMKTPTRLGGMETTVRLARWDGATLSPWYTHEKFPWDMSQVNIHSGHVDAESDHEGDLCAAISQLKDRLSDKGKWTVLVPLIQGKDGRWRGAALNKKQEPVVLEYDRLTGVSVTNKEG